MRQHQGRVGGGVDAGEGRGDDSEDSGNFLLRLISNGLMMFSCRVVEGVLAGGGPRGDLGFRGDHQ